MMILGLILLSLVSFGQVDETKNYLYLYSDSVIYSKFITFESPFFSEGYFILDSNEILSKKVKFYKKENDFYASLNYNEFALRVCKGKINLYEIVKFGVNHTKYILNFYNKNFEDLKDANYTNLKIDLADNKESLLYLNKFKKIRNIQTVLCLVGGASILGCITTLPNNSSGTGNIIALIGGGCCFWASYFISFSKPKQLRRAIDSYNK